MQIIQDPPADGPANMQRDLDLLETLSTEPILRLYQWTPHWVSYGYFQTEDEARTHFANDQVHFVKRPTGGGIVDHRHDCTYSLLIPKNHPLAQLSRTECYLRIHEIIHQALVADNIPSRLVTQESGDSASCFEHPVPGDIIEASTIKKLAGAAQRRTRHGLLHQGSIQAPTLTTPTLVRKFEQAQQRAFRPLPTDC